MGDNRRKVNFARDSPPGGSRSSRQTSDSGVGSLSDPASPRATQAQVTDAQWNDLESLQDAYRSVYNSKVSWKKKAQQKEEELVEMRKAIKEREASWRGVIERNEQLEDEKKKMLKDKKVALEKLSIEKQKLEENREKLEYENDTFREEVAKLRRQLKEARQAGSPTASGGSGGESKLRRSSSKREQESDKKQKERLKERFESKSTSDATSEGTAHSSKTTSSRARRKSYVEPFGSAAPPSPTRAQYPTYTTTPMTSPAYAYAPQNPAFSSIPRTERPTISITTEEAIPDRYYGGDDYEDSMHFPPPPLPKHHSSRASRYPR